MCDHPLVYARNCITAPFLLEDDEGMEDDKFIKEKSEVFIFIICIILKNKGMFRYFWKKCSIIWNEIHLILLTNFIFESQWIDGIKILFSSAHTHQIFNSMN